MTNELGFEIHLDKSYEQCLEIITEALKVEGFGVITTIDIQNTFKTKLEKDFRRYIILGACNPSLAYRALSQDPVVGLLLPCNITIEEEQAGRSLVRIANPEVVLKVGTLEQDEILDEVAFEARTRLERVAGSLLAS